MLIEELPYRRADDEWLPKRLHQAPDSVDTANVLSYLTQHYGNEPLEPAWTDTPRHDHVQIGWVFAAPADDDADEIIAIPLLETEDGTTELFIALADQRADFEQLAESGVFKRLDVIPLEPQEWRP